MRLFLVLALSGAVVSGCEKCSPNPYTGVNVGVGTGGVHGGVSVGRQCGPVNINVGAGNYYHFDW
ncbi:argininosuccinate lyase [Ruegeria sediminis]|uniref:Argininosuccinate lyase n=1 Tax=Ruegeria sediminis TaxID=2583820 RepID=A0ABY2WUH1_9RHOB|nr:argininosuccinate lyase [Ruegeria sediminis]TMV05661.1 argininosuccinate lyase [Ruegeria sediminis]